MDDILTKPFKGDQLFSKLSEKLKDR
jgi:hypothetical protein